MFRLLLPNIFREPQGSTKVTYVFYIYGENGMVSTLADSDRQGEDRL